MDLPVERVPLVQMVPMAKLGLEVIKTEITYYVMLIYMLKLILYSSPFYVTTPIRGGHIRGWSPFRGTHSSINVLFTKLNLWSQVDSLYL